MKYLTVIMILFIQNQCFSQTEDDVNDHWLEYKSCMQANIISIIKDSQHLEKIINTKKFKSQNELLLEIASNYRCDFKELLKKSIKSTFDILSIIDHKFSDKARKAHDLQLYFSRILNNEYAAYYESEACILNNSDAEFVDFRLLMEPSLGLIQMYNTEVVKSCENESGCLQALDFQYLFAMSVLLFEPGFLEYIQPDVLNESYLLIKENEIPTEDLIYLEELIPIK